ncbi:MAG: oligosaccharide flippase family protein [Pseudomonadota bacterium]
MSLARRTARAAGWTLGARLAARILDILVLLVLARVLGPEDFGLVALAIGVVQLTEAILDMPVADLIARERAVSRRLLDTCFTIGLLRGLLLGGLLAAAALPLAGFYGEAALGPLILAIALAPLCRGLLNPRLVLLARRLDYRLEVSIEVASKAVACMAALSFGLFTGSYWALALVTILAPMLAAIASYAALPFRPRLSLTHWRRMRHAVGWNFARQVAGAFNWQVGRLMAGRLVPLGPLGHLSIAEQIAALPRQVVVVPLLRPLVAGLAAARSDARETALGLAASRAVLVVAGPLLLAAAVLAPVVIEPLLGADWKPVAPVLTLLCLAQLLALAAAPLPAVAIKADRVDLLAGLEIAVLALRLPLLWLGLTSFGIIGAAYASLTVSWLTFALSVLLFARLLGTRVTAVLRSLLAPALGLAAMALPLIAGVAQLPVGLTLFELVAAVTLLTVGAGALHLIVLAIAWRLEGRPPGLESLVADLCARILRPRPARREGSV